MTEDNSLREQFNNDIGRQFFLKIVLVYHLWGYIAFE